MDQERVPKSAFNLYLKLYCKKKACLETKYSSNLMEATKSWLTLSDEEKQHFTDKYEAIKKKVKKKFADYLVNVEPVQKKRKTITSNENEEVADDKDYSGEPANNHENSIQFIDYSLSDENQGITGNYLTTQSSKYQGEKHDYEKNHSYEPNDNHGTSNQVKDNLFTDENVGLTENEMNIHTGPESHNKTEALEHEELATREEKYGPLSETNPPTVISPSFMETEALEQEELTTQREWIEDGPLPEPVPPTVISSLELFHTIKAMHGPADKTWDELTEQEKRKYRKSVLLLKQDYIARYKAFLESLPSELLFHYYNKTIQS